MMVQYEYIKSRHQFGKQCVFQLAGHIAEEHVLPEPERMQKYLHLSHANIGVQSAPQLGAHEIQTTMKPVKNTGMFHVEGGWPKEINPKDEEIVQRYRRRVEKDESWPLSMRNLLASVESCVLQNNAIDIYDNYFGEMLPIPLTMEYNVRTMNLYEDPRANTRPVSHLSWCPGGGNRLAASYTFMEFEVPPADVNPYSYIWDIENPNKPLMALRSSSPLMTIEFNPSDPSMLISGLVSGQVCNWDIRTGNKPVQISHLLFSHRNAANQALWTTSKTHTEFFSSSTSGAIKWWDIRSLKKPTDTLVMDLEEPTRADVDRAIGVSVLQYEPTMGSKFMAGTQNGIVLNVNRKGANVVEKLALRFNCHVGPVIAIDRNPFSPKNFLTVGDWSAKIWADDTKEGCLLTTCKEDTEFSGGCWSRSRYSVFFTINTAGVLEVYDILTGMHAPLVTHRVCDHILTAISPCEEGQFLAVGSRKGNIYLLECSDGLTSNNKNEKAALIAYLERCSRFEKMVDNRLKEMRLLLGPVFDESYRRRTSKRKSKSKESRVEKAKSRDSGKIKASTERVEFQKKKSRAKKYGKDTSAVSDEPDLVSNELQYFQAIEAEMAKHIKLEERDTEMGLRRLQEIAKMKMIEEHPEPESSEPIKERKLTKDKVKVKRRAKSLVKPLARTKDATRDEEIGGDIDSESIMSGEDVKRRQAVKIFKKICATEVCKPKVCCKDVEEELKAKKKKLSAESVDHPVQDTVAHPVRTRGLAKKEKWYRKLSESVDKIPERSAAYKRKMLILKNKAPDVIRKQAQLAKIEVLALQERLRAAKRGFASPQAEVYEEPEKVTVKIVEEPKEEEVEEPEKKRSAFEIKKKRRQSKVEAAVKVKNPKIGRRKGVTTLEEVVKSESEILIEEMSQMDLRNIELDSDEEEVYPRISDAFLPAAPETLHIPRKNKRSRTF